MNNELYYHIMHIQYKSHNSQSFVIVGTRTSEKSFGITAEKKKIMDNLEA